MLSLLLLVQFPRIFASEFVHSKVCGADHIAYSYSDGSELFNINGEAVGKALFCEALQFYHAKGCIFEGYLGNIQCDPDLSLGMHHYEWFQFLVQKSFSIFSKKEICLYKAFPEFIETL